MLDVSPTRLGTLAGTLSADERARAARFRFERHHHRWVSARGALRAILAGYLRRAPASLELAAGAHGKPFLENGGGPAPLRFNLAHADDVALVAVGWRREVGVDIEREAPERADLEIARRLFAPDEARALADMPVPLRCRAFFALWTAREAYAKAIGRGLEAMRDTPTAGWTVRQLAVGLGYAAAVAVEGGAEAVRCWSWQEPARVAVADLP
jgi:4'-phosphopantetheinyl transferase